MDETCRWSLLAYSSLAAITASRMCARLAPLPQHHAMIRFQGFVTWHLLACQCFAAVGSDRMGPQPVRQKLVLVSNVSPAACWLPTSGPLSAWAHSPCRASVASLNSRSYAVWTMSASNAAASASGSRAARAASCEQHKRQQDEQSVWVGLVLAVAASASDSYAPSPAAVICTWVRAAWWERGSWTAHLACSSSSRRRKDSTDSPVQLDNQRKPGDVPL